MPDTYEQPPEVRFEVARSRLHLLSSRFAEMKLDFRKNHEGLLHAEHVLGNLIQTAWLVVGGEDMEPGSFIQELPLLEQDLSAAEQYMALLEADKRFLEIELTPNGLLPEFKGKGLVEEVAEMIKTWKAQGNNES